MIKGIEDQVFQMYESIRLGTNPICKDCIAKHEAMGRPLYKPASIWHVGNKFEDDENKIIFVGKPARGELGMETGHGYIDTRECGEKLFFEKSWPYWSYTREIASRIYGTSEEGWEHIAFTNIVKCNNSDTTDAATTEMKENCLNKLGVLWREIEVLKPKRIIFYTHWFYDDYIDRFRFGDYYQDKASRTHTIPNGKKVVSWWHREFLHNDRVAIRFLRTSHPERQQREGFVGKIVNWITYDE
ncbi:MAG: hypothetical protein KAX23_04700 [Dehalococcoidia bacterium]|nr:hypothetical protein [Chloroflexota bacterium]MCK4242828.1 hypothetical protein [Dehalococcoidia bacterium]